MEESLFLDNGAMLNLKSCDISSWLVCHEEVHIPSIRYRHRKLTENLDSRVSVIPVLKRIVELEHEETRRYLRKGTESNLDPLQETPSTSIVNAYPYQFPLNTKKGYFGEIMAGLIAENIVSHESRTWRVPTFMFRFHELAFDQLEMQRKLGTTPQPVPGQTGEDCVAFSQNESGKIVASLVCEGKCTN